jgi:phosphatidyl-myo-inositol dimannoside synthase
MGKLFAPNRTDRGHRMTLAPSIDRRRLPVLALVPYAFGGFGGIARYNRDLLSALAAADEIESITILPRRTPDSLEALPQKVWQAAPIFNRFAYSIAALKLARALPNRSVIFCGHIRMVPLAAALSRFTGAFLWLQVHGDDAWPAPRWHVRWGAERSDLITSVSRYTRDRMIAGWWKGDPARIRVLPNTVDDEFQPGPKPKELIARHGLADKKVLLTVSRIAVTDHYKGHDRVIAALPAILQHHPEAVYVIAGDGDYVPQLKALVSKLGLMEHVRFVGRVPADELVDHYRLADVFIMPSTEEGFGIVFLEAASSGIHVIGGRRDGSWDALREGRVGVAIDPLSPQEIVESVCLALEAPSQPDPKRASVFSQRNFRSHVAGLVNQVIMPHVMTA